MSEYQSFAGDVKIDACQLTSVPTGNSNNITNQVIGIQIYEDLFSPYMSGNIVLKESVDYLNNLPITGQEFLYLKISTPLLDDKFALTGTFYVYKVSDREYTSEKNTVYKLHFISLQALIENSELISKGYEGKISDIVRQHLLEWVGEPNIGIIEDTKNSTKYVSNFWNRVKNLNFLTNQAVNQDNSPTYLFFQNRDGFNFMTLDSLYSLPQKQTFNYNMNLRDILPTGEAYRLIENDYQRINEIILPDSFDTAQKQRDGTYASTLYTYDLSSKNWKVNKYQYQDTFTKTKHLNPNPLTAKAMAGFFKPEAVVSHNEQEFGVMNNYGDVSNSAIVQARVSLLSMVESFKVTIIVPGRTDYTVGQKVYLKLVQPEPINEGDTYENEEDKIFSGNYLIGAINHTVTRERHECTIELIKDSWLKNVDNFTET